MSFGSENSQSGFHKSKYFRNEIQWFRIKKKSVTIRTSLELHEVRWCTGNTTSQKQKVMP